MAAPAVKKRFLLGQSGATVVEFAVVVALLLVVLLGIMEFGFIFMQKHFVANAAREGVRIGVRANNYNCFDTADTSKSCTDAKPPERVYRKGTVASALTDCSAAPEGYLCSLYANRMGEVTVSVTKPDDPDEKKTLKVAVTAPNFFPQLISGFLPGGLNYLTIAYTASGDYEDPSEP